MSEVITADGATIQTDLPAEAVADLQAKPEEKPAEATPPKGQDAEPPKPAAEPAKPAEPAPVKAEDQKPEAKAEDPETGKFRKPTPISNLLAKNHEYKAQLETEKAARVAAETKLAELSKQPDSTATDNDVTAFAEKLGADPAVIAELVALARKGFNPALPKEVQDLIAKQKESEALQVEHVAFDTRVSKMAKTFPNEPILEHKDKLMKLAYSDEKAPDGEAYNEKELSELYFGFIKPEVEPGKRSAETSSGGTRATGKVTDFEEIHADPAKEIEFTNNATSEEFQKYQNWLSDPARNGSDRQKLKYL